MADLDFSHKVQQVPAGADLPKSYQRNVKPEVSNVPDLQRAVSNYAANTNWMSALGSEVASRSSAAIAAKLGGEAGKNPYGELTPSFTEFDENFKKSYDAQAHSTLTIQANKLITDSHIQLASQPRVSPQMIAKAQQEVQTGLQKIYALAPSSVRPSLEQQSSSTLLQQQAQLMHRYTTEQRNDRKDNLAVSVKVNTENAHSLAMGGNSKAATLAITQINSAVDAALAIKDISAEDAKSIKDSARQSYLSGDYTRLALIAQEQKKLPEFFKNLADNKSLSDKDKAPVINNVLQYMNQQHTLRSMDEELKARQMMERINFDTNNITGGDWNNFTSSVSPLTAQKVHFKFLQQLKKQHEDNLSADALIQHWDNPTVWANSTKKTQNKAFNDKVQYAIDQSHKTTVPLRSPTPLTRDQAEVMVAAGAGGQIPVFTKSVKNKLKSSNPGNVESGIQQIHALLENGNGQALSGLDDQDWSMYSAAQSNRDSPDPIKANQDAHNRIYNQDPEIEKLNKTKWANILTKKNTAGISNDNFALKEFGMSKSDFINPTIASAYGTNILSKFSNFFAISGDYEEAKASTKIWVDQNYGDTFINGIKHKTLHPIEKEVGFDGRDGTPYIQQNIVEQFNEKLVPLKELYDKKISNELWETVPINISKKESMGNEFLKFKGNSLAELNEIPGLPYPEFDIRFKDKSLAEALAKSSIENTTPTSNPSQEHGFIWKTYDPIKLKRTMRTKEGTKTDIFNVILVGNMFGSYDVSLQSRTSTTPLFHEAPYLGIMSVIPNRKKILEHYTNDHK